MTPGLFDGTPVLLDALLASRERRAVRQKALLAQYPGAVLCLLCNIPGPVKDCPAARRVFFAGAEAVNAMLRESDAAPAYEEQFLLPTGPEGWWVIPMAPEALKARCMALEEDRPLGRLWDLDVIGPAGVPLSRRAFSGAGRACMVCGGPAADCVSRQLHSRAELEEAILRLLQQGERS